MYIKYYFIIIVVKMNKNSYFKEFLSLANEIESDDEDNYNNQDEKDILSIDTLCIHNHYNEYQNSKKLFENFQKLFFGEPANIVGVVSKANPSILQNNQTQ